MSTTAPKPKIGISCGDPNGIGFEIIIKTFENPQMLELCTPVVFASSKVASYHRNALDKKDFNFNIVNDLSKLHTKRVNLYHCIKEDLNLNLGTESKEAGAYAIKSLKLACDALEQNQIEALVTAPIHKNTIQAQDFNFTGHTDFLEDRFKATATMVLLSQHMRLALATVHVPLGAVTPLITQELISQKLKDLNTTLKTDFGISKGKIAVLALNPHAGDGGVIGTEDSEIAQPAIAKAFESGIMAFGPFAADGFFGAGKQHKYDMILALYHDQGLAPFKALSFGEGVNYSAGLPIIRTSPDHGTAFEIAGQGLANPHSFREAIYTAIDLLKNRKLAAELNANPLKINRKKK